MCQERMRLISRCLLFSFLLLSLLVIYIPIYYPLTFEKKTFEVFVEGWGTNISRSLPLYILPKNDTAVISGRAACSEKILLLVFVCSAVVNYAERLAIRETWGNYSSPDFRVVFLLGLADNATIQEIVEDEASIYSDIIQENFIDSYNNLTLKSVMLLKNVASYCQNASFILKTDDDMFIQVMNLLQLLKQLQGIKITNILLGELICDAKPILNSSSKWYAPSYMFKGRVYPRYLSGTGYLMDRAAATKLYETALTTPIFHLEDVFITGICAKKANIKPRFYAGFSYQTRPLDVCLYNKNSYIITSHRVSVDNMYKIWIGLKNVTNCPEEPIKTGKKQMPTKSIMSRRNNRCT